MDFDESRLYFSHQQLKSSNDGVEGGQAVDASVDLQAVRRHFREFLRKFILLTWVYASKPL